MTYDVKVGESRKVAAVPRISVGNALAFILDLVPEH